MKKLLSASSINGTNVLNSEGNDLGNIKDLMIDISSGEICYAVLSFGGFLGIGDKYFAIPWSSFATSGEDKLVVNVSKERLEKSPGFDKDNWPSSAQDKYFGLVNDYYNSHPKI